MINETEIFKNI